MKNFKEYPVGYNLWNDLQGTHTGRTTIKEWVMSSGKDFTDQ